VGASYASCTSEIASAFSRNEGVPGSIPGVGFLAFWRIPGILRESCFCWEVFDVHVASTFACAFVNA
jgi:hypothetical protein